AALARYPDRIAVRVVHARERLWNREAVPARESPAALRGNPDRHDRTSGEPRDGDGARLRAAPRPARTVGRDPGAPALAQTRDELARRRERALRRRSAYGHVTEVLRDARDPVAVAAGRDHHTHAEAAVVPRAEQQRLVPDRPQRVLARIVDFPIEVSELARAQRPAERVEQCDRERDQQALEQSGPTRFHSAP